MGPRELDFLPGYVERQASHLAQVETKIDRAFELDLEIDDFLKLLVIGQSEFAEHSHVDTARLVVDDDHGFAPLLVLSGESLILFHRAGAGKVCGGNA